MASNRLTQLDRATIIWRKRVQGMSQHDIARDLGINQSTVSRHIKRRSTQVLSLLKDQVEEQKVLATARLEKAIEEAWAGWKRSCGEIHYTRSKRLDSTANADAAIVETVSHSSHGVGNPQFLAHIGRLTEQIAKLWGLHGEVVARANDTTRVGWTPEEEYQYVQEARKRNEERRQKVLAAARLLR